MRVKECSSVDKPHNIQKCKVISNPHIDDVLAADTLLIFGNLVGEFSDFKDDGKRYESLLPEGSPAKTENFLRILDRIMNPELKTVIWTSSKNTTYFTDLIYSIVSSYGDDFVKTFSGKRRCYNEYRYTYKDDSRIAFNVYFDKNNKCTRILGRNFIIGEYGDTSFAGDINILKSFKALDKTLQKLEGKLYFTGVLMNPPYDGNLHLKILSEVLKRADDVVDIAPVRWLQDPLAEFKRNSDYRKFEASVSRRIEDLDIISQKDATSIFDTLLPMDLGIYKFSKMGGFDYSQVAFQGEKKQSIHKKVINRTYLENIEGHSDENRVDGIRVKVQKLKNYAPSSTNDNLKKIVWKSHPTEFDLMYKNYSSVFVDGYGIDDRKLWWSQYGVKNKYTKDIGEPMPHSLKFNSIEEAKNFEKSCWTRFFKYCMYMYKIDQNVPLKYLPYMNDYSKPWDDRRYCDEFGIEGYISDTESVAGSEWDSILKATEPYM